MPFVTDILGPRRPVAHQTSPLVGGRRRRTSTIGTHPDEPGGSIIDLRARDAVALAAGGVDVLGEIRVSAHLVNQVIEDIRHVGSRPQASGLDALRGCRVGPGFRSKVSALLPEEVQRASLLHLLLDDWVGAALVSGYGVQHEVEPLRARGMRRFRRLDMWPVDAGLVDFEAHFRDSHMDDDLVETIVHEYTVAGTVDPSTRTIKSVSAEVRVLPWQECPGAIGSAARVQGMGLVELRDRVRGEFVGDSTCTHLNDTLRAIADLDALLDLTDAR